MLYALCGRRWERGPPARAGFLLLVLLLGGCSMGGMLESEPAAAPAPEPDYQKLIAEGFASQLAGAPPPGLLEVSPLHRTEPVQPGDWFACVRRSSEKEPGLFAVFFKDHKIDSVRRAVLVDKCGSDTYALLPPPKAMAAAKDGGGKPAGK